MPVNSTSILAAAIAATRRRRNSSRILFADDFNRADSAASLGDPWSAITGTWGISGGQAYNPSATADAIAVVDSGSANGVVRVSRAALSNNSGLCVRVVNATNWIRLMPNGTSLLLQKKVSNLQSTIATLATGLTFAAGDVLEVRLSGSSISSYLNGVQQGETQTVTDFLTSTKHGICMAVGSSVARWDDFRVTS